MKTLTPVKLIAIAVLLLSITACGRKEVPQPIVNSGPPEIASLEILESDSSTQIVVTLAGGEGGIGFQVDRSEIDPFCNCPTFWQRHYEEPPLAYNAGKEYTRMLRNTIGKLPFVYRLRAVDATGRLGPWSDVIWPPEDTGQDNVKSKGQGL